MRGVLFAAVLCALSSLLVAESQAKKSMAQVTKWPELVGKTGEEAKAAIMSARPDLKHVDIIPADHMVTMDFREDRVRIFVDAEGKVVRKPMVG
ncbi:uncharacterized protein [Diadema setosum]|uniref:uncharacterized protein n=1 Tax=Diadema setosum TaxID=31175 RepID=UPI003B3A92AA